MKKLTWLAAILALGVVVSTAYADIALTSKDDMHGKWKLQYTKNSPTAKETVQREDVWAFAGGKITITNIARDGGHYDQIALNYDIENGKLKVPFVGRSGFDVFSLEERNADTMTLKGKFGELYYFVKK